MKVAAIAVAALLSLTVPLKAETIEDMVVRKATDHGVPTDFARALIKVESNFNPNVKGAKGEYGLGQILCSTARSEGFKGNCKELAKPEINLEYTMLYLRRALDQANGDICGASNYYSTGFLTKPTKTTYCKLVLKNMPK